MQSALFRETLALGQQELETRNAHRSHPLKAKQNFKKVI
jgi:hypothetical protein